MSDLPPKASPAAPIAGPQAAPDAFDPGPPPDEFAHIPVRRQRPPLLAIGAAVLALLLAVRLRQDVAYALSPRTPIEISDVSLLTAGPDKGVPLNRFVRLQGRPERESSVLLDARGSWTFTQFFRLRGSKGRVFVRRVADPLPVGVAEHDVFAGRLMAFKDLSFAQSIGKHFAARVTATHFFAAASLGKALTGDDKGPARVQDIAGDEVALAPADVLVLDVARPDQFVLTLPLDLPAPRASGAGPGDARSIITAAGGTIIDEAKSATSKLFTVALPGAARDVAMSRLDRLGRGVRMRAARDTVEVPVRELLVTGGVWHLGRGESARKVPAGEIIAIRTRAPVEIPEDAVLLVEGEAPANETKSLVILAFLAAFAAVNLLSLRRAG